MFQVKKLERTDEELTTSSLVTTALVESHLIQELGQFLQTVPVVNHPYLPVDRVVQVQIQVGFMRQIELSFVKTANFSTNCRLSHSLASAVCRCLFSVYKT